MRVLVCGGGDYLDAATIYKALYHINPSCVIHGGFRGTDAIAGRWAAQTGTPVAVYLADWEKYGKAAGPIRNQQMLDDGEPDMVLAFPGGRGTENMCKLAAAQEVIVVLCRASGDEIGFCVANEQYAPPESSCD